VSQDDNTLLCTALSRAKAVLLELEGQRSELAERLPHLTPDERVGGQLALSNAIVSAQYAVAALTKAAAQAALKHDSDSLEE